MLEQTFIFCAAAAVLLLKCPSTVGECKEEDFFSDYFLNMDKCSTLDNINGKQRSTNAVVPYVVHPSFHAMYTKDKHITLGHNSQLKIRISQDWQNSGVSGIVWDAAVVLSEYLLHDPSTVQGKTVLEVGAGTGVPAITAAFVGAKHVTATDLPAALPLLSENMLENFKHLGLPSDRLSIRELIWGKNLKKFEELQPEIILAADVVYDESVFEDLLETFRHFLSSPTVQLFLSCRVRYPRDEKFLEQLKANFCVTQELYDSTKDIYLFVVQKKS